MKKSSVIFCLVLSFSLQQVIIAQKVQSFIFESWNGSTWTKVSKTSFTYDGNFNQTSRLQEIWAGSSWHNSGLYTNNINSNGDDTLTLTQQWSASNTWSNNAQSINTYTLSHKLLSENTQQWNGTGWQNYQLNSYTYDNNSYNLSRLSQNWNMSTMSWGNHSLNTFTVDVNGDPTLSLGQAWDLTTNTWIDGTRTTNTYIAPHKPLSYIDESFGVSSWHNTLKRDLTYDNNLYLLSQVTQSWTTSSWQDILKATNFINANGNPTLTLNQTWNNPWTDYTRITFTYIDTPTSIKQYENNAPVKIYPLPATDFIQLEINENLSNSDCILYDETGKNILMVHLVRGINTIDISDLGKGFYFFKLQNGERLKLVKQ